MFLSGFQKFPSTCLIDLFFQTTLHIFKNTHTFTEILLNRFARLFRVYFLYLQIVSLYCVPTRQKEAKKGNKHRELIT